MVKKYPIFAYPVVKYVSKLVNKVLEAHRREKFKTKGDWLGYSKGISWDTFNSYISVLGNVKGTKNWYKRILIRIYKII